jgi:hypothetical protein
MKKILPLAVLVIITNVSAFAQAFDDLPYSNPDAMAYFQQEMKSLFQFMAGNKLNIPFYVSFSGKFTNMTYTSLSTFDFYANDPDRFLDTSYGTAKVYKLDVANRNVMDFNVLTGGNIRINRMFSIPLFGTFGYASCGDLAEFEVTYNGNKMDVQGYLKEEIMEFYFGTGLFMNADTVKGGVLLGAQQKIHSIKFDYSDDLDRENKPLSFRVELVPLINTSQWKAVGKMLNSILGYLGFGAVINYQEEENSIYKTAATALNAGLDLTFNKITFGPFDLNLQAVYNRGSYDAAAKANTYGMRAHGVFSFPLGFGIEGGYKQFYYIFEPFVPYYNNTPYVNASIFFPMKDVTFGVTYSYDGIYKHAYGIAMTLNFLSGFFTANPSVPDDRFKSSFAGSFGARYRHGGWEAWK